LDLFYIYNYIIAKASFPPNLLQTYISGQCSKSTRCKVQRQFCYISFRRRCTYL